MPLSTFDEAVASASEVPPWERDVASQPFVKQAVKTIAGGIFARIAAGELSYGTRLPSERELAEAFSASRNIVRQALEFLELYGVVARRAGAGAFVKYRMGMKDGQGEGEQAGLINISAIAETVSPFEMSVAESIIEPEIARLATIYMSMRDLALLRSLLEELEAIVTDADRFAHLERQFMNVLCHGTHNSAVITMYRVLHEVRKQPEWCALKKLTLTPDRIRQVQRALQALCSALERRDGDKAVECMRLYLSSAQEGMIHAAS